MIRHFTATKAFLNRDGKILVLRESNKYQDGVNVGRYDVPGGRLDPDESLLDGLKREVKEESGLSILDIASAEVFFENDVVVKKQNEEWHIRRLYFSCNAAPGDIILSDDHDAYLWIDPAEYKEINIIANLTEVFEAYLSK